MKRVIKSSTSSNIPYENLQHYFIIVDDDGTVRAFNGKDEASWILYQVGYSRDEIDTDEAWAEYCEEHLDKYVPRDEAKVSDYTEGRRAYNLAELLKDI